MNTASDKVRQLSSHLQANLGALGGKVLGPAPHFRLQLLIPVVAIVAATVLFTFSTNARKSLLLKTALFVSTRMLQRETEEGVAGHEQGKE